MNGHTIILGLFFLCVGMYGIYDFIRNRKKPSYKYQLTYFLTTLFVFALAIYGVVAIIKGIMGQTLIK